MMTAISQMHLNARSKIVRQKNVYMDTFVELVKKGQLEEEILKTAIETTAARNLRYKETLEDLSAKMTLKRGLAAECQAHIDIRNQSLDQVNKRLRELRR